ncbi:MAG: hypothetical protein KAS32_08145 [Candidatus Peribacteraceae bacterium]|nr:hypothetical protein [Candidatus Peribacteraceae bacterium]
MKRVLAIVLIVIFTLTLASSVSADPDVTVLPSIISVGSPALIKVDPQTTQTPIRVTWSVYNTGNIGMGSFPLVDGIGACYFSNDDGNATCGPTPFYQIGETELYVYVITPTGTSNRTVSINVSSAEIPLDGVNREDNKIYMYFIMGQKEWMKYSIYNEDLSIYQSERALEYNISEGRYMADITLNPGVYYFTFMLNDTGTYGGAMKRIEIPSSDFLTIQTDKTEYWTGEKITISGTTNANQVSGDIYFPDGTKADEFSLTVGGNQSFSYEFAADSDWPEGEYEIKTDKPIVKSTKFSITEFFEISPESVSESLDSGDDFYAEIEVTYLRANSTNISISTSGDVLGSYVSLSDTELNSQESATITIDITEVDSAIEGKITLSTDQGLSLDIPVSIAVASSGTGGDCPACSSGALVIDSDYLVWSSECLTGSEIYTQVKITNNGATTVSDMIYTVEDIGFDQSFESLENYGYIDFPVADTTISAGDSEYIVITTTPESAGKYEATVTILSDTDSAFFVVNLECFDDITYDLTDLTERLDGLSLTEEASDDIESDITKAENAIALGSYKLADEYYKSAELKVDTMELAPAGAPMDMTLIIVVIIIVVAIAIVVWFMKFKQPQVAGPSGEADDLEGF